MDCIFCKIASGEIPAEIVYENEHVVAFKDIAPEAPVHIVVIPKKHYTNIIDMDETELSSVLEIHKAIRKIAEDTGIAEDGFRIVNNCNEQGGQTVFHLHYHLLGGRNLQWPPG